jgi:MFS family permease
MARMFASLAYPQFRMFWVSNIMGAAALMVQLVAQQWLIVELTDSGLLVGFIAGIWGFAFALSSVPVGVLADRANRRNLLAIGLAIALGITVVIGLLVAVGRIEAWHLLIVSAAGGVLMALRIPAGQAMTARLVPHEKLMNAVSLNQMAHSLPHIAGPAAGGVLVVAIGIAGAYFLTSGVLLVALLLILGIAAWYGAVDREETTGVRADIGEAVAYLRDHRQLLGLTAAMLIPFILGQSYVLLLPLYVETELGLGPAAFGLLSACLGVGSVLGALTVARFGDERQIGILMFASIAAIGVAAIVYGLASSVLVVALVLLFAGAAEAALFAAYQTLLVVRLPDQIRGRVLGLLFTLVAMFPLGAAFAGAASDVVGLRAVAIAEGLVIVPAAVIAWLTVLRSLVAERPPAASN